jgi:hypothetical protein
MPLADANASRIDRAQASTSLEPISIKARAHGSRDAAPAFRTQGEFKWLHEQ